MAEHDEDARRWRTAVARAGLLAARASAVDENCWDEVAIRDTIAVTLYALATRSREPVAQIGLDSVLWQLQDADRIRALLDPLVTADPAGDPAGLAARWAWLERVWNPEAPFAAQLADQDRTYSPWTPGDRAEPRWGGMTRGIARGLPDPALEVCLLHAAGAVSARLLAASTGLPKYTRVAVTAGPYEGDHGYARGPVWALDDERETVTAPPYGYEVLLDHDNTIPAPVIEAAHLRTAHDGLAWPHHPAGSPREHLSAYTRPPQPGCAELLESILARSTNPQVVPEDLRARIAGSDRSVQRLVERRAAPRPRRFTWQAIEHCFVAHNPADPIASVFEVEFTRKVMDPAPVSVLALDESEVLPLVAAHLRPR